ncbi:hypothetical protein GW17_00041973 [Ensete ventricosum]|nr:hypothetical protein GW17_00041973 [Ensete ventricosum]
MWEDPLSPSKWKEEHFVLTSLTGWALLFYGGYKLFGGKDTKEVVLIVVETQNYSLQLKTFLNELAFMENVVFFLRLLLF